MEERAEMEDKVRGGVEENIPRSRSTGEQSVATERGCFESQQNS